MAAPDSRPALRERLLASRSGALLLLRESAATVATPCVDRASEAAWSDYAPAIERRVLWQHAGEAAMLYRAAAGAAVPRHGHGHDEECLMLAGEVFLDDVLLLPLDYQLAPAGSAHGGVGSPAGALIYAHGDLDLDVQPG